jgi:hypothetical protein
MSFQPRLAKVDEKGGRNESREARHNWFGFHEAIYFGKNSLASIRTSVEIPLVFAYSKITSSEGSRCSLACDRLFPRARLSGFRIAKQDSFDEAKDRD